MEAVDLDQLTEAQRRYVADFLFSAAKVHLKHKPMLCTLNSPQNCRECRQIDAGVRDARRMHKD